MLVGVPRLHRARSSSGLGWSDRLPWSYDPCVLGRFADGMPYSAPLGELLVDRDDDRVQCHLCGSWFRQLGSTHLPRAHGVTAEQYRELVGLLPRHPLWAPSLIAAQAARYRARLPHDERLRAGMRKGAALAKSGDLKREARVLLATRPVSLERARQLEQSGAVLGKRRAERYRARRGARARELGFDDLTTYYRHRYGDDRLRVDELADELRCCRARCAAISSVSGSGRTGRARTERGGESAGRRPELTGNRPEGFGATRAARQPAQLRRREPAVPLGELASGFRRKQQSVVGRGFGLDAFARAVV
jgi:hypothetical protein